MAAIINALADYAKKESPVLTGAPKAPTAEKGTGGDIIATCAYVLAALEGIDLSDYAKTTDLDEYAKKVSPALSGTPTAPTAAKTVNNTQIATTAFVHLLAGAANNGGIVDSLLAQNGYVKFANGLILQWGYYVESQNPTDYRYWSIPFTSHYITMATKTYYEPKEEAVPWLVGIDMQKFICGYGANFIGSSYVSCVGIGCQLQWGINTGGAVRTSTLPIPFTNVFLAVASTSSEWCCPGCSATNTTVTTRAYQSNRPDVAQPSDVNWIIIGCQPQWGFTNNTGRPYITFPFKFSNVFTAISCICHNGSPSEANTVYNVSISGMNIGASGGGSGKYWCAFGVAQQQWGYSTGGSGAWALKFNGVYTAVVVGAPGFPAREFCGFTFDYTLTGWSFAAGYNSPVSYIRPTTTAISLGY